MLTFYSKCGAKGTDIKGNFGIEMEKKFIRTTIKF